MVRAGEEPTSVDVFQAIRANEEDLKVSDEVQLAVACA
jgi:hypothetical protein